ncbi:MAG: hypothetical protein UX06_C0043G0001 [Candidatus Giovannonibacteria bacterium GW2011_GWA2_45_21]|uniref:Uncharacterized protein n=1 Tax=Candidatus Giovannonibacteria bacterium GW2011_GWA2_45_21 TaxID=1618649 RepID=A0A0G1Q3H8_9BACT|nr:MAG: hypothetical protein UX06_C0043G0001 [Candidatus Giovannonibacteria bacterium GW2011_GWA2_45_21]
MPKASNSEMKAPNRTRAASPADPIAYPLVTALVVFPTASSASVMSRTSVGRPAISEIPPALSVIGPNESIATIIPAKESIDVAAIAIP